MYVYPTFVNFLPGDEGEGLRLVSWLALKSLMNLLATAVVAAILRLVSRLALKLLKDLLATTAAAVAVAVLR